MPTTPPTTPATPLASVEASGSRTRTAAIASTPSRSLSSSQPLRRPRMSRIAHAASMPSAAPLAPSAMPSLATSTATYAPPAPASEEDQQRRPPAVAALEQPAEQRDRPDGDRLVAGRDVREERRERAPRVAEARGVPEVVVVEEVRLQTDRDEQGRDDEHPRGPRALIGADAGDLPRPQPRQLGPRAGLARRLGHTAAIQLGRALLDPRSAVRALRDVRRNLRAAALADEVQIRAA